MIMIDKILFQFKMADESFAKGLYADWDAFCQKCFIDILEEELSRYDNKDSYIEFDSIDLSLGGIAQEDFYEEFPKRVRAELNRLLLSGFQTSDTKQKRLENLLHYLCYGFCLPGWDDTEYDLFEELSLFKDCDEVRLQCFAKPYCLERIIRQLDRWQSIEIFTVWFAPAIWDKESERQILADWIVKNPYSLNPLLFSVSEDKSLLGTIGILFNEVIKNHSGLSYEERIRLQKLSAGINDLWNYYDGEWMRIVSWLASGTLSQYEKQRYLADMLDIAPGMVVLFIRETKDEGNLKSLALLLQTESVRKIINSATENHSEVDVPAYWYHLYVWLIEHYPFNGVAMFGDKQHFIIHLHERFLFFVRKKAASLYLSKAELTIEFLLEVFGVDYYLDVLSVLYHNQVLDEDGSPAANGYYNREIFYLLLRLSVIRLPQKETAQYRNLEANEDIRTAMLLLNERHPFENWLLDESISIVEKKALIKKLVREDVAIVQRWLKGLKDNRVFINLAFYMEVEDVFVLLSNVSHRAYRLFTAIYTSDEHSSVFAAHTHVSGTEQMREIFRKGILKWIASGYVSSAISDRELVRSIVKSIMPMSNVAESEALLEDVMAVLSRHSIISDKNFTSLTVGQNDIGALLAQIHRFIDDNDVQDIEKQGILLGFLESYTGSDVVLFAALHKTDLLSGFVKLYDNVLLRRFALSLAASILAYDNGLFTVMLSWSIENTAVLASEFAISEKLLWERVFIWLSDENVIESRGDKHTSMRHIIRFLTAISNETDENLLIERIIRIYERTAVGTLSDNAIIFELLDLYGHNLNAIRTLFEQHLNDPKLFIGWLKDQRYSIPQKRSIIRKYAFDSPKNLVSLLRISLRKDTFEIWSQVLDIRMLLDAILTFDKHTGELLCQITAYIQTDSVDTSFVSLNVGELPDLLKTVLLGYVYEELLTGTGSHRNEDIVRIYLKHLRSIVAGAAKLDDKTDQQWKLYEKFILKRIDSLLDINSSETIDYHQLSGSIDVTVLTEMDFVVLTEADFDIFSFWLSSTSVSDTMKRSVLNRYLRWKPKMLWEFIMYANSITVKAVKRYSFTQWLGMPELLQLISAVSVSWGETLRQVTEYLTRREIVPEHLLNEGVIKFISHHSINEWYHTDAITIIMDYVGYIKESSEVSHNPQKIIAEILKDLNVKEDEKKRIEELSEPDYISIHNAGLCLLASWFPRLFDMLHLLNEEKNDLKDMDARIRAVFILQRLVTDEKGEYMESELAFNRLLVAMPFSVTLPKTLDLTDNEIQVVESMLSGVKANWDKLKHTSVKGFQNSFIKRDGKLEQRDDRWVLNVESRSYDMLLDKLPWSYNTIRLAWLKKRINVIWRDKEEFDFDNINY